jgi:bifunctional non-homologous end joining protein LigD
MRKRPPAGSQFRGVGKKLSEAAGKRGRDVSKPSPGGEKRSRGGKNAKTQSRVDEKAGRGGKQGSRAAEKPRSAGAKVGSTPAASTKLAEYRRKRDPKKTAEPFDAGAGEGFFVVQKHAARRLHYDFRLAIGGVLVSWAVPKGPSYNPRERRLAVHVEDHPLSYANFEGTIPEGEYGAGSVIVWDRGPFRLREGSVQRGSLKVDLQGTKLVGGWALVRMKDGENQWLLIKEKDEHADPDRDVTAEEPASVISGLTVEEIGQQKSVRQWNSSVLRRIEALPRELVTRAPMPSTPQFMKARLASDLPRGKGWLYEIKLDGVRALAIRRGGQVRLVTRNAKEVAFRYPEAATALEGLAGGDFVMDGEIVAFDSEGRTRFELLQGRIHLGGGEDIAAASRAVPVFYYAFDLPWAEGCTLEAVPLIERKGVLKTWLTRAPRRVRFSDHVEGRGEEFLKLACARELEGVIAKRADSPYRGTRSGEWVKVKCLHQQEFVIGGFTPPRGGRNHFGSLILGVYEGDDLVYVGKVGTGFSEAVLRDLYRRLKKLERPTSPFAITPRERGIRWLEPELVAEVRFTEWTSDGKLRHPAFLGLRDDKRPRECVREVPGPTPDLDGDRDMALKSRPDGGKTSRPRPRGRRPVENSKTLPPPQARRPAANPGAAPREAVDSKAAPSQARLRRKPASTAEAKVREPRARETAPRAPDAGVAREVQITNPSKIYYPAEGITKGEVVDYYHKMAGVMIPYLEGRPLTLVRYPNGIHAPGFFQKDQPDSLPDWIPTVPVSSPDSSRRVVDYLLCNDERTLVYVANLGSIDLHPWASRIRDLERPDLEDLEYPGYVVWDLDPPEDGYPKAAAIAPTVREILEGAGLSPYLKTSGGKGLHLYVPLLPEQDHETVRSFAEAIAMMVVQATPGNATLERSKRARAGKVYVDFMQNGRGKTVVAPYSLRAKEHATVSMPITWKEFEDGARPEDFTLRTAPGLVAKRGDVWSGFWDRAASLEKALRRLTSGGKGASDGRAPARKTPATSTDGKQAKRKAGGPRGRLRQSVRS